MELIIDNLGAIIKATGQFTVDFNIRERLEGLFSQVISHANFAAHDASFFSLIWQEVQQLIKVKYDSGHVHSFFLIFSRIAAKST